MQLTIERMTESTIVAYVKSVCLTELIMEYPAGLEQGIEQNHNAINADLSQFILKFLEFFMLTAISTTVDIAI